MKNAWKGIEYFVLKIQIQIVERREDNIILVNSKKGEGSKKDFLFQNQRIERREKIPREIYSCTVPPPPPNLSDLGPRDTDYMPINRSENLIVLYLFFSLLVPIGIEL